MQKFMFALIIATASAAPYKNEGPLPGYQCPQEDIDRTGCKGPKDCLYPNPEDCHSFIQCNDAGLAYKMDCAPIDLVYNDTQKQCDYPSSTVCSTDNAQPSTSAEPSTPEPTVQSSTEQSSSAEPSSEQPSSAQPSSEQPSSAQPSTEQPASTPDNGSGDGSTPSSVCSEQDIADTGCMGPKDCLYPNPSNCSSYIQCTVNADNRTGTPVEMPCPDNLEWNDNKKECDWPIDSTCPKGSTPAQTSDEPSTPVVPTSQPSSAEPSSAEPSTAEPSTAEPSTAEPSTAEPSTAEPSTAEPSTAQPSTAQPSTPSQTSTEANETSSAPTTLPPCRPDDDDSDADLDLQELCRNENCTNTRRTIAHPSNNAKYIICASSNSVQKCGFGLLWDDSALSCNYAGLVDPNGPKGHYR